MRIREGKKIRMVVFVITIVIILLIYRLIAKAKKALEEKKKREKENATIILSVFIVALSFTKTLLTGFVIFLICISVGTNIEKDIIKELDIDISSFSMPTLGFLILLENVIAHTFILKKIIQSKKK